MEGIITRGTTIRGLHVNEDDKVECSEDDYQKLFMTGDIKPAPAEEVVEEETPESEIKTSAKPKKKK